MPTVEIVLARPHVAQRQVIREARRFNVLACGRRFGKTTLGIDRLIEPALNGYPVGWFSPTYKMLAEVWRELLNTLNPMIASRNVQEHRLDLLGGGVVDMWSLDLPDTARGRAYKRVVVDEAAMVPALLETWQAVIRPTLTDHQGDAWFLSTPRGRNGFAGLYELGADPQVAEWASWQFPTSSNPFIDATEIESAQLGLPERIFAQEYLAQFIDDGGGVFRRITESATAIPQRHAIPGHTYLIGADWGKHNDFTVFAVLDVTLKAVVEIDRSNQLDYVFQVSRLKALRERYGARLIVAEENSIGDPVIEQLRRIGLPVFGWTATGLTKGAAIEDLALAFERGILTIIPDPVALAEFQSFQTERLPGGGLRYAAPEGLHDDIVMAVAMAWQGVDQQMPVDKPKSYGFGKPRAESNWLDDALNAEAVTVLRR